MKSIFLSICAASFSVLLVSCQTKQDTQSLTTSEQTTTSSNVPMPSSTPTMATYTIGDHVPSNQVCMVNNAYMGKDQFIVSHEGNTYYGCCNMCTERLPKDASVRVANDPLTGEEVNKSTAYIVLADANGGVVYFKDENNYQKFLAEKTF